MSRDRRDPRKIGKMILTLREAHPERSVHDCADAILDPIMGISVYDLRPDPADESCIAKYGRPGDLRLVKEAQPPEFTHKTQEGGE